MPVKVQVKARHIFPSLSLSCHLLYLVLSFCSSQSDWTLHHTRDQGVEISMAGYFSLLMNAQNTLGILRVAGESRP